MSSNKLKVGGGCNQEGSATTSDTGMTALLQQQRHRYSAGASGGAGASDAATGGSGQQGKAQHFFVLWLSFCGSCCGSCCGC